MATVDVVNTSGEKVSQRELPDALFNVPAKASVLHEVVVMQLANRRSGTGANCFGKKEPAGPGAAILNPPCYAAVGSSSARTRNLTPTKYRKRSASWP